MRHNQDYPKTIKSNVFKFYIFTVALIGIAGGLLFSFKLSNFIISTSIVSVIFLIILNIDKGNKPKKKQTVTKDEDNEIRLYKPKSNKDDPRLVELRLDTLNFKISELEESDEKIISGFNKSSKASGKKEDDKEKELKKMFNPYKSPFEPINPVVKKEEIKNEENTLSQDDNNSNQNSVNLNENNILDDILQEKTSDAETDLISDATQNFTYTNNDIDLSQEESAAASEYSDKYDDYVNTKTNSAIGESYIVDDGEDDVEWEDIRGEVNNILKFRPREQSVVAEPVKECDSGIEEVIKDEVIKTETYEQPPMNILKHDESGTDDEFISEEQEITANKLIKTLESFGVGARVVDISKGPSVTRYELQPNPGVKVSKIVNLSDDIALNLAATGVRIEAPIPGKAAVGIEVPNKEVKPVYFGDVVRSSEFTNHASKLAFALGKDVAGRIIIGDVAKMPHMLIAGATGSGKSVCINTLIASLLYKASPDDVKLLLIDPKVVELGIYNGIPHLLIPVVTDPKKAAGALSWAVVEMTNRYKLFAENNVRDIKGYNAHMRSINEPSMPQIVIIIDELADLMMVAPNDVEDCICRLAQMARAAGMHLVIATQRPSVDVITGVIKANIPSRISFAVSSQIDSRTILDAAGAEKLLGRGDMLFNPIGEMKAVRVQGSFISDSEVESLVNYLKNKHRASYDMDVLEKINAKEQSAAQNDANDDDELLPQVVDMVIEYGQASASLIQRKFKVGYSRAARILDQMEAWGIVGSADGSKPRQILITKEEWSELNS